LVIVFTAASAAPGPHIVKSQPDIGFVTIGRKVMQMREFQRAAVRLHILHHAADDEVHGAWLTEELRRHGYNVSPGTLYPTLHRLEADGLLVSQQQVVDGRARRVYRATPSGRAALTEDRRALRELAQEVLGNET
jgi:DNA-binding PadR family transcriptional regulator